MMSYDDLSVEKIEHIVVITLNAPDKANAWSLQMKKDFCDAIRQISEDDDARAVILTGAGSFFCAGGDIEGMKARINATLQQTRFERIQRLGEGAEMLTRLEKPVIAAVNGAAVGAGFSLAMSCDIRIASEKARFGAGFVLRGLCPDNALSYHLPRVVGASKALELLWTGNIIDAHTAATLGIVCEVVSPEDLMTKAWRLTKRIAQQPPIAVALTKRLVYRSMIDEIAQHVDLETYAQQLCWGTEDFREGALAFLEKRPAPPSKGT